MGSPISVALAEFSIQYFENLVLKNPPCQPLFWKRYVDDIITAIPYDKIDIFLKYLNSQNEHFQFTCETQKENAIPFLDLLINRENNGHLQFSIFRKATHTNRYLDVNSYHPLSHKRTTAITLFKRVDLCSEGKRLPEINNVCNILEINGYNKSLIRNSRQASRTNNNVQNVKEKFKYVSTPYIKGTSERVNKIMKKYGIKLGHRSNHTLCNQLSKLKDKRNVSDKCGVIYEIECNDCNKVYIGETGKELHKRIREHQLAVRRQDNLSALYHHIQETGHTVNWENPSILAQENSSYKRKILESMYSHNNRNRINRFISLPDVYSTLANKILSK